VGDKHSQVTYNRRKKKVAEMLRPVTRHIFLDRSEPSGHPPAKRSKAGSCEIKTACTLRREKNIVKRSRQKKRETRQGEKINEGSPT